MKESIIKGTVRFLKNIILLLVQLSLFIFLGMFISQNIVNLINDVKVEYSNYTYVRSFENYGVKTEATKKDNLYVYKVEDKEYSIESNKIGSPVDKTVKIYYDILEPDNAISVQQLRDIDSFYSDGFSSLLGLYFKIVVGFFVLGFVWYLIDVLKYNKVIWKKFV